MPADMHDDVALWWRRACVTVWFVCEQLTRLPCFDMLPLRGDIVMHDSLFLPGGNVMSPVMLSRLPAQWRDRFAGVDAMQVFSAMGPEVRREFRALIMQVLGEIYGHQTVKETVIAAVKAAPDAEEIEFTFSRETQEFRRIWCLFFTTEEPGDRSVTTVSGRLKIKRKKNDG